MFGVLSYIFPENKKQAKKQPFIKTSMGVLKSTELSYHYCWQDISDIKTHKLRMFN